MQKTLWKGPLPDPNTLHGYESTCKGAANRIIKMTENQSQHRQKMEDKVISSNIKNEGRGMIFAFVLTGGLAIIGAILILLDKQVPGYISLFAPSIFQAGSYIYGKYVEKPKRKEEELENAKKKKSKR